MHDLFLRSWAVQSMIPLFVLMGNAKRGTSLFANGQCKAWYLPALMGIACVVSLCAYGQCKARLWWSLGPPGVKNATKSSLPSTP
eukprot:550886-Pelagomonas_calceolata.AAC.3